MSLRGVTRHNAGNYLLSGLPEFLTGLSTRGDMTTLTGQRSILFALTMCHFDPGARREPNHAQRPADGHASLVGEVDALPILR
jgi:hypothetical protein